MMNIIGKESLPQSIIGVKIPKDSFKNLSGVKIPRDSFNNLSPFNLNSIKKPQLNILESIKKFFNSQKKIVPVIKNIEVT